MEKKYEKCVEQIGRKKSELSSKLHYDDEVLSIDGQYLK